MAKKGQKFKIWSAEEKYKVIKPIIDLETSLTQVGKETGMLHLWTKLYREKGIDGLNNKIKRGYKNQETIVHTDQGSVYSSEPFNNIFDSYSISRSMSRAGTPTDNPVIESKNGWIKKEMYIDFDINNYNTVREFIDDIVWDNNNYCPSYALNYKTPIEYRTQLGFD